ncbi:hypothetical protein CI109_102746 [Kwoniella shandongensis]|uniref:Uncharacterized protein n=1 Tax=Kwoniella shandongensis TaxID=1734106 RepID=A0A5M6BV47_9TREE|nr:uncharacterized protein CI109_004931 [Kwoniella shandongensis]KAA5526728.1 hypothetical protein CI109_004931 [Kwoniella shandongensis]
MSESQWNFTYYPPTRTIHPPNGQPLPPFFPPPTAVPGEQQAFPSPDQHQWVDTTGGHNHQAPSFTTLRQQGRQPTMQRVESFNTVDSFSETEIESPFPSQDHMSGLPTMPTTTTIISTARSGSGRPARQKKAPLSYAEENFANQQGPQHPPLRAKQQHPPKNKSPPRSATALQPISTNIPNRTKQHPPSLTISYDNDEGATLFLPDPQHSPIQLKGLSKNGLLPAPPGSILDVNDLLILHPVVAPTGTAGTMAIQGHTSQYEMYTCRVCSKTYDGKNARSVARRHLQDKHGVPLAVQKRRSRWDFEPDRPKNKKDAKDRNLKAKREWANKNRQQIQLEKTHSTFLERFGPNGIVTACGMRLVAPKFRSAHSSVKGRFLNGAFGKIIIPEDILRDVQAIRDGDKIRQEPEEDEEDDIIYEDPEQEDISMELEYEMELQVEGETKGMGRKKAATISGGSTSVASSIPFSRSITPQHTFSTASTPSTASPPSLFLHPLNTQIPTSSARTFDQNEQTFPTFPWLSQSTLHPPYLAQPAQDPLSTGISHGPEHPTQSISKRLIGLHHSGQPQTPTIEEEELPCFSPVDPPQVQQTWSAAFPWQQRITQSQTQLEPAHEIEQRWENMHLGGDWDTDSGDGNIAGGRKEGSVETEGEAVAAESLLNLHSTPLRGPDNSATNGIRSAQLTRGGEASTRGIRAWSGSLLEPSPIVSPVPTRPIRARSFIQPFKDPRPEVTRSLSFDNRSTLDDPFLLNETPSRPTTTGPSTERYGEPGLILGRHRKRHSITMPSPSPHPSTNVTKKRKVEQPSPSGHMAKAESISGQTRSALRTISVNTTNLALPTASYDTPVKPSNSALHVPSSITKEWLLSSPCNADMAASLGLVPTHFAPATPGLRSVVGAEATPEMTILEARAKKRKNGLDTPGLGVGRR